MTDPLAPAALDEWERLARAAQTLIDTLAKEDAVVEADGHEAAHDAYLETCEAQDNFSVLLTPERILGLIAAAQQGAEDSAESTRQFMRAERNYTGWNRTAEVARGLEAVIDEALTVMREPMTLADARRARDLLTPAAVERSKANAVAREARAAAPEERDDA
jgi:hypothetical protein